MKIIKTLFAKITKEDKTPPYTNCLNCGAELQGMYCHQCGQYASKPTPKVIGFVTEYLCNAFTIDSKFPYTLWYLLTRPGYLTNAFLAGKYTSYMHPIKLNMFFLFFFLTVFLLFSSTDQVKDSFSNLVSDEDVRPLVILQALEEDSTYSIKLQNSERDTVKALIPYAMKETNIQSVKFVGANQLSVADPSKLDTFLISVPRVLLEDSVIVAEANAVYRFVDKKNILDQIYQLSYINDIWHKLVNLLLQYFPLIILLTAPFLSLAVRIMHWKLKKPHINYFVFSLHYTAFMEMFLLLIYFLYLTLHPDMNILKWMMIVASCVYLLIADRAVYGGNSWIGTILKALLTNVLYFMIAFLALIIVFVAAIIATILENGLPE